MKKFKPFVVYFGRMDYNRLLGVLIQWGLSPVAKRIGVERYYEALEGANPYRHSVCVGLDLWALRQFTHLIHWSMR